MKTKVTKLISILLVVIMLVSISSSVFAAQTMDNVIAGMQNAADTADTTKIVEKGGGIMGVLQTIGMIVSVIVLIIIGIKYMMGSAEEKAEYKKTFIPYVVGAVLVFTACAVAGAVVQFAQGLGNTGA